MKTKLFFALLTFVTLLCLLCSCKGAADKDNDNGTGDGTNVSAENLIFKRGVNPTFICNNAETLKDAVTKIQEAVFYCTYSTPAVFTDEVAPALHEVVLGKTNREISKKAYTLLDRINDGENEVSYLVYSNGSSVAIAFDEDRYHINAAAVRGAIAFADLCDGKEYFAAPEGALASLSFDALEYQEELDRIESEEQWIIFEQEVNNLGGDGAAVTAAARDYYNRVCTDNVISWFANLYDPVTGGYYFSNGARNTPGFLPDAESTTQAVQEFHSSGMLRKYGNSYIKGLPEWFRNQLVSFLKKLQDPDTGYFYHPQWSKEEVNSHLSRRARDMTKSCSLLNSLGSAPTYDTPSGTKGDGIKWDGTPVSEPVSPTSSLTGKLQDTASVIAVSKVIPTASVAVPDHLVNDKTFKAYLDEQAALNAAGKRSFYAIGNEIGSQVSEIKTRDKALKEKGADYSLGDILIDWYNEHQDKETGLWDKGVNYDATNALLKIVGTYDSFGYIFPNAEKALQSCLVMAVSDDEAETVCYVYNIWFAIEEVITNVNKYSGSDAEKEYANSVRKTLLQMAPEAIRISAEKQLRFKKDDGSFSFGLDGNCITSQGMRVGIPGDGDGDVNATIICLGGTINRCLRTMGLEQYAPGFFTEADRLRYIAILEDLGPVIKDDVDVPVIYEQFDDETIGEAPLNITSENLKGSLTVEERPGGEYGDRAVKFVSKDGDYEAIQINSQSGALTASCFVFETDMMIESGSAEKTITQIYLQDAVYMLNFTEENGKIKIVETSASSWALSKQQDLGVRIDFGEWFNIKIQYFVGDHDTVRIKVFINEELIAVTDNYFDKTGTKLTGIGTPKDRMDYTNIIGLSSADVCLYIDNTACYKTAEVYKPVAANEKQPPINVDPPERDLLVYDFEDSAVPDDFTVTVNDGSVSRVNMSGDGALKINGAAKDTTPSTVTLPINIRFGRARCAILDADITVSADATGTLQRFWFAENEFKSNPLACFDIAVKQIDGTNKVVLVEAADGKAGAVVDGVAVDLGAEFNLRLEYYEQEMTTLVYVNDKLVGLSGAICKNASKYSAKALVMEGVAGATGSIYIDDLIFEKDVLDFSVASSDGSDKVVNDFTALPEGGSLAGGAVVADGVATLGAYGAEIKLPVSVRNSVNTSVQATVKVSYKLGEGSYLFAFTDASGKEIIAFEMVIDGDNAEIYEYYAGGRGILLGSAGLRGMDFNLHFNYYYSAAVANILIGSEPIAATSLTYLADRDGLDPAYLVVKQLSRGSKITLDDSTVEKVLALYKVITPAQGPEKPSASTTENFEKSSYKNLPSNITGKLAIGADVSIKSMVLNGSATKVLAFKTVNGSNDSVTIDMAEAAKLNGASVTVFEADIMIDALPVEKRQGVEFYLRTSGDDNANKFIVYAHDGKSIEVSDYLSSKKQSSYTDTWNVKEGEFFKLRMEYTVVAGEMKINIFVNGNFVGRSTVFYPTDVPYEANEVTRIVLYTHGGLIGTTYIDNMSFYQTNTLTETFERHPGEGFVTGGLTFDGMTTVWKDIDCGGTSTERPLDDKLIIRNTSTVNAAKKDTYNYIDFFKDGGGQGLLYGKFNNDYLGEIYVKSLGGDGNCYTFETMMQLGSVSGLSGATNKWILRFGFTDGYRSSKSAAMPKIYGAFNVIANDDGTFIIGNKTVTGSQWLTLTLEYYPENGALVAYVDGEVVATERVDGNLTSFARVAILLREEAQTAEIKFDNMYAAVKAKTFAQTLPEAEQSTAEILPVKGGANGIVVLIHDDGDLASVYALDKLCLRYGLRADIAMIANRVYDYENSKVKDEATQWQKFLATGRWSIINHSYSHTAYSNDVNGEFVVDEEKVILEIIKSGEMLRAAFPDQRVLTYAYPGYGTLNTTYGDALYDTARKIINNYYIAAREMGGGSVELSDIVWDYFSTESMATSRTASAISRIEEAAGGAMSVLFTHKVGSGGDITVEAMEEVLAALAEKVNAGLVWNTSFENATLYLREAECATVSVKTVGGNTVITLTDTLDDTIYNFPLTIKVKVDSSTAAVRLTQGERVSYAVAEGGYVLVDVVPDGGDAILTPIALTDIPTVEPEEPAPTPDIGIDDPVAPPTGGDDPTPAPGEDEEEEEDEPGKFNDKGQIPTKPDDAETNDGGGWT